MIPSNLPTEATLTYSMVPPGGRRPRSKSCCNSGIGYATPSAAPPQPRPGKTLQGKTPKRASAAPSHHSNAPIELVSQSNLSKIVALWTAIMAPMPHMLPAPPKSSETGAIMLLISRDWEQLTFQKMQLPLARRLESPAIFTTMAGELCYAVEHEGVLDYYEETSSASRKTDLAA